MADDPGLALTLARYRVTQLAGGAEGEALAGQALLRVHRLIVVVFAPTLTSLLVAVGVETVVDVAPAWATDGVAPPLGGTRLLHLSLTVPTTQQGGVTLALVSMFRVINSGTGGVVLARVEVTDVKALVPDVSMVALAGMSGPSDRAGRVGSVMAGIASSPPVTK